MNIRIVTHINYEGDLAGIQEVVSDFAEALVARGFGNIIETEKSVVNSIIIVKENKELSDGSATLEEFWAAETEDQILSALPAEEQEYELDALEDQAYSEMTSEGGGVHGD